MPVGPLKSSRYRHSMGDRGGQSPSSKATLDSSLEYAMLMSLTLAVVATKSEPWLLTSVLMTLL